MPEAPESLSERLNLQDLIADLVGDLKQLRAGQISVREARARADLAKQILRGVHYAINAQKFLADQAKVLPPPDESPRRPRSR